MKKPDMIVFDYGGTLVKEANFDGLKGSQAVFNYAASEYSMDLVNKFNSILDTGYEASQLATRKTNLEYPFLSILKYACDSIGVKFSKSLSELEKIYWDNAANATAREDARQILEYLKANHIRVGVISNITFSGDNLRNRLKDIFPEYTFEFIIASSDYLYRKPDAQLFSLAFSKAVNINKNKIWYCGDQYDVDVVGAIKSGFTPIWLNIHNTEGQNTDNSVITVHSFKELIDFMS